MTGTWGSRKNNSSVRHKCINSDFVTLKLNILDMSQLRPSKYLPELFHDFRIDFDFINKIEIHLI